MLPVIPISTATLRQQLRPTRSCHRLRFGAASTDEALGGFGSRDGIDMFNTHNIHHGMLGEEMGLRPKICRLLGIAAEASAFAIGEEEGLREVGGRRRKYIRRYRREEVE